MEGYVVSWEPEEPGNNIEPGRDIWADIWADMREK